MKLIGLANSCFYGLERHLTPRKTFDILLAFGAFLGTQELVFGHNPDVFDAAVGAAAIVSGLTAVRYAVLGIRDFRDRKYTNLIGRSVTVLDRSGNRIDECKIVSIVRAAPPSTHKRGPFLHARSLHSGKIKVLQSWMVRDLPGQGLTIDPSGDSDS